MEESDGDQDSRPLGGSREADSGGGWIECCCVKLWILRSTSGVLPDIGDAVETSLRFRPVRSEIDIDEIEQVLSRVHMVWHWISDFFKIGVDAGDWATIAEFSLRKEEDSIEEIEGRGGRLVYTRNDDDL